MRLWTIYLSALILGACADPLPRADSASDLAGKKFDPPAAGWAALYVTHGSMGPMEVSVGQRTLGQIEPGMWLRTDVPAGTYDVRCRVPGGTLVEDSLRLPLTAGETTFVSVRFVPLSDKPCRIALQDAAAGRTAVLSGSRGRQVLDARD